MTKALNIHKVMEHKQKNGAVKDFPGSKNITNEEVLELPVEILAPAALEGVITKDNADKIKAKSCSRWQTAQQRLKQTQYSTRKES